MANWSRINVSSLTDLRIDPEYFQPYNLDLARKLSRVRPVPIEDFAYVTDGIHASPEWAEEGGVTYLSAKCVKDNEIVLDGAGQISQEQNRANPRTQACVDDVLLTTVGTIGNAAVVDEDLLPANMDRHLGIIRITDKARVDPYYLATFLNCKFGRFQSVRESTGNVQLNLFIEKINKMLVPIGPQFNVVNRLARQAYELRRESKRLYGEAEQMLLEALGLRDLNLPSEIFCQSTLREAWQADRLDTYYFEQRHKVLLRHIANYSPTTIGKITSLRQKRFIPQEKAAFEYIEISDVDLSNGLCTSKQLFGESAPDRAQQIVQSGDVIVSTVRPMRGGTALVQSKQDGHVCSSGFAVLQPIEISPEYLLTYLRLKPIRELLNRANRASMYPAVTSQDVLEIPIALLPEIENEIRDRIQGSHLTFYRSLLLLEKAKQNVENMIEEEILRE